MYVQQNQGYNNRFSVQDTSCFFCSSMAITALFIVTIALVVLLFCTDIKWSFRTRIALSSVCIINGFLLSSYGCCMAKEPLSIKKDIEQARVNRDYQVQNNLQVAEEDPDLSEAISEFRAQYQSLLTQLAEIRAQNTIVAAAYHCPLGIPPPPQHLMSQPMKPDGVAVQQYYQRELDKIRAGKQKQKVEAEERQNSVIRRDKQLHELFGGKNKFDKLSKGNPKRREDYLKEPHRLYASIKCLEKEIFIRFKKRTTDTPHLARLTLHTHEWFIENDTEFLESDSIEHQVTGEELSSTYTALKNLLEGRNPDYVLA